MLEKKREELAKYRALLQGIKDFLQSDPPILEGIYSKMLMVNRKARKLNAPVPYSKKTLAGFRKYG